jgi:diguanylate cyclase (GGDEF)-like protein
MSSVFDSSKYEKGSRKKIKSIIESGDLANFPKQGDFLARYGGDEFIIIVKASSDMDVIKLSNSIKDAAKSIKDELGYEFTASVGYAKLLSNDNIEDAIHRADQSLYEAKEVARVKGLR